MSVLPLRPHAQFRLVAAAILAFLTTSVPAQLVGDINRVSVPRDSLPHSGRFQKFDFVELGGKRLFTADEDNYGRELWSYDPATGRVALVKDIRPGGLGSYPRSIHVHRGRAYFAADDGVHGHELWTTDGTAQGTRLVRDIDAGSRSSLNASVSILSCGNKLVFSATRPDVGAELFVSDGTASGTSLLRDIRPGVGSSQPLELHMRADGRAVYFRAAENTFGSEPWFTDGTPAGTRLLADLEPGRGGSTPRNWLDIGASKTLVSSHNGWRLWVTDGTSAGTSLVRDGQHDLGQSIHIAGVGYFAGFDTNGVELWRTDGTARGTRLFADVTRGPGHSYPSHFVALPGSGFVFATTTNFRDYELRVATSAGVQLVRRFPGSRIQSYPARSGPAAYFVIRDAAEAQLWRTNGRSSGTTRIAASGSLKFSSLESLTPLANGGLLLTGKEAAVGSELFRIGSSGIELVANIRPPVSTASSNPEFVTELGGGLVFAATDGRTGRELWSHDGSETGVPIRLADLQPGAEGSTPEELTVLGNRVFFAATTQAHGRELYVTDGTPAGTKLFLDINPGPASSNVGNLRAVGHRLYFAAATAARGRELWVSEGAVATTRLVADLVPGTGGSSPALMVSPGGDESFVFAATTPQHGRELWVSNGRASGTKLLRDIVPGGASGVTAKEMVVYDGHAYFAAAPNGHDTLWRSDGSASGTTLVGDFQPWGRPRALTVHAGHLYFLANFATIYPSIWSTDGSTSTRHHFTRGASWLTSTGSRDLLFEDWSGTSPLQRALSLFEAGGSVREIGLLPGGYQAPAIGNRRAGGANYFATGRESFFFAIDDPKHGRELWRYRHPRYTIRHGDGCAATGDRPTLEVDDAVRGRSVTVRGTISRVPVVQALFAGVRARTSLTLASPWCQLYLDPASLVLMDAFVAVRPAWQRRFAVPGQASLAGAVLTWQAVELGRTPIRTTNAVWQRIE